MMGDAHGKFAESEKIRISLWICNELHANWSVAVILILKGLGIPSTFNGSHLSST